MGEVAGWSVHYHPLGNGLPYFYRVMPQRLVTNCSSFNTVPRNMLLQQQVLAEHSATVGKAAHAARAFIHREYGRILDCNSFSKNRLFLYIFC
jgi:hypothetical protein